jgi:DNA-binding transcriptional LysR family regulator
MISQRVRHFLAIAEAGSFSGASAALGIGQPPLSQSIQRLEQSLGVTLFERTPRGVRLTPAGNAFLADARVAVAAADRARVAARSAAGEERPVRVGVTLPAIFSPLRRLVEAARRCAVEIIPIDGASADLLDLLERGELDISFVTPPVDEMPTLQLIPIGREPLVAALPDDLAALPGDYAPMREMAPRLIVPPRSYGEALHDAMISMFTIAGYRPVVVAETTRVFTMLSLTSAGVGASIIAPSMARAIHLDGVTFRPFAPDIVTPKWEIALAHFPPQPGSPLDRLVAQVAADMTATDMLP